MRAIGRSARSRSRRRTAFASRQSGHRWVLGFIELSRGDAAAALGNLERAWEIRDSVGVLEPGHRLDLADTLEALIAVGELDGGRAEARAVGESARRRSTDRGRWRSRLVAARSSSPRGAISTGAQTGFERALAEHARTQDPFQHARTLLAQGVTQRRAKQRGAARVTLEQALAVFERLGAPLWAREGTERAGADRRARTLAR